jgi:hypothetical protein
MITYMGVRGWDREMRDEDGSGEYCPIIGYAVYNYHAFKLPQVGLPGL